MSVRYAFCMVNLDSISGHADLWLCLRLHLVKPFVCMQANRTLLFLAYHHNYILDDVHAHDGFEEANSSNTSEHA